MTLTQDIEARYIFAAVARSFNAKTSATLSIAQQRGRADTVVAGDGIRGVAILPWAQDIRWTPQAATAITYTIGGATVERSGVRFREVMLSGDVGPMPERLSASVLEDEAIAQSYQYLENVITLMETVAADPTLQLNLYALNEGQNWVVEPLRWPTNRGPRNRTGLHYDLHFRIMEMVRAPDVMWAERHLPSITTSQWKTNPLAAAAAALRKIIGYVRKALVYVKKGLEYVDKYVAGPLRDIVKSLDELALEVLDLASQSADLVSGLVHLPADAWQRARRISDKAQTIAAEAKRRIYDYCRNGAGLVGSPDDSALVRPTMHDASVWRGLLGAADDVVNAACSAVLVVGMATAADQGQVAYYPLGDRDTLEQVALRLLGDPLRASEIAALNGLRYPYTAATRRPGVASPGDVLLVPNPAQGSLNTLPWPPGTDADEMLFGIDFALDESGDLRLVPGSEGPDGLADLDVAAGEECFTQDLDCIMATELGTDLLYVDQGLPGGIGLSAQAPEDVAAYRIGVDRQLRADDRVLDVRDYSTQDEGNGISFEATVVLRTGKEVPA